MGKVLCQIGRTLEAGVYGAACGATVLTLYMFAIYWTHVDSYGSRGETWLRSTLIGAGVGALWLATVGAVIGLVCEATMFLMRGVKFPELERRQRYSEVFDSRPRKPKKIGHMSHIYPSAGVLIGAFVGMIFGGMIGHDVLWAIYEVVEQTIGLSIGGGILGAVVCIFLNKEFISHGAACDPQLVRPGTNLLEFLNYVSCPLVFATILGWLGATVATHVLNGLKVPGMLAGVLVGTLVGGGVQHLWRRPPIDSSPSEEEPVTDNDL